MNRDDIIREADAWLKMNGLASDGQTCFAMALFAQHIAALAAQKQKPSGYAYRYFDGALRFNNGCAVNRGPPVEAVPYWFAPPALAAPPEDIEALTAIRDRQAAMLRRLEERETELDAEIGRLTKENERLRELLSRIRRWDHLDTAADGAFWKHEIEAALRREETT